MGLDDWIIDIEFQGTSSILFILVFIQIMGETFHNAYQYFDMDIPPKVTRSNERFSVLVIFLVLNEQVIN